MIIESLLDAGYDIKGYFDFRKAERNPYQLDYLGFEGNADLKVLIGENLVFPTVGDNRIRRKLIEVFDNLGFSQFAAIDSTANVSQTAKIQNSTYIGKNVLVNALAEIGNGVILNTGCIIEHECMIGNGTHIAPGAVLAGNVHIGDNTFVGANSVIKQGVKIGADVIIGAGTVILNNIGDKSKIVGNPGREL